MRSDFIMASGFEPRRPVAVKCVSKAADRGHRLDFGLRWSESGAVLSSVGAPRVYHHIVAHIERAIYDGSLARGDRLPSERELGRRALAARNPIHAIAIHALMDLESEMTVPRGVLVEVDRAEIEIAHAALLEAVEARDGERARCIMQAHIADIQRNVDADTAGS